MRHTPDGAMVRAINWAFTKTSALSARANGMDIGFSRRNQPRARTPVDRLNHLSLLAELAAAQTNSATAIVQSRLPSQNETPSNPGELAEKGSFHPATAALLSGTQE
jgi:hypothetical protein